MIKTLAMVSGLALATSLSLAAQVVVHAVDGTVKKVDTGTKTVVVDAKDGTEHTFHYTSDITVDGAKVRKRVQSMRPTEWKKAARSRCTTP